MGWRPELWAVVRVKGPRGCLRFRWAGGRLSARVAAIWPTSVRARPDLRRFVERRGGAAEGTRSRVELPSRTAGTVIGGVVAHAWPAGTWCIRRTVRQALGSARRRCGAPQGRSAPKLGPYLALIDSWLVADREAPRKQRDRARVWERLRDEQRVEVSERQVRRTCAARRGLGGLVDELFVPLRQEPRRRRRSLGRGLGGDRRRAPRRAPIPDAGLLLGRLLRSGVQPRETQQALLEAQSGRSSSSAVPSSCSGTTTASRWLPKELEGRRRVESDRSMRCARTTSTSRASRARAKRARTRRAASRERWRFRRSHLVPVPEAASLRELNNRLAAACVADSAHIRGARGRRSARRWA